MINMVLIYPDQPQITVPSVCCPRRQLRSCHGGHGVATGGLGERSGYPLICYIAVENGTIIWVNYNISLT